MPDYDFKTLSDYEFETLTRDLLQKRERVYFESFSRGRDRGIDLRRSCSKSGTIVVQCKHYAGSSYSSLKHHLLTHELPKIRQLKPSRYILVTSLGLTPNRVDELISILSPFCGNSHDIVHRSVLNGLLAQFDDVERKHFKLWLTSVPVLQRILHSRIFNATEFEVEGIRRRIQKSVQTKAFWKAKELLETNNFCIIAGDPGIGKTTLSELLLADYLRHEFQPVVLSQSIDEAFDLFEPQSPQIFYFDDFLGRVALELKLSQNEDQRIVKFIKRIAEYKNKRLILSTRDYILAHAKILSESLHSATVDSGKFVLQLSDYTKLERAKILYNHLYFSDVPAEYKQAILSNKGYRHIVAHPKYNPRVIENMTELIRLQGSPPAKYVEEFVRNLEDPSILWKHIYESQLKRHEQDLLLVLACMPRRVLYEDLSKAFRSFHSAYCGRLNHAINPDGFKLALKALEGNFVRTYPSGRRIVIEFANPSIKDLMDNRLVENGTELLLAIEQAVFFSQCATQLRLIKVKSRNLSSDTKRRAVDRIGCKMGELIASPDCALVEFSGNRGSYILKHHSPPEHRFLQVIGFFRETLISPAEFNSMYKTICGRIKAGESNKDNAITVVTALEQFGFNPEGHDELLAMTKALVFSNNGSTAHFSFAANFVSKYPQMLNSTEMSELKTEFESYLEEIAFDDFDDVDELESEQYKLEKAGRVFGVDVELALELLDERLTELRELQDEDPGYSDEQPSHTDPSDDVEVDNLFDTLLPK